MINRESDSSIVDAVRKVLQRGKVMFMATAVDGNPSVSSVFYGYDEPTPGAFEIFLFSFLPTVKLQQISYNQKVEVQIAEPLAEGIKGIQISGRATFVKDKEIIEKIIKPKINVSSNKAFEQYYDLPVARWVKIVPTRIKLIDFYQKDQFQFLEYWGNQPSFLQNIRNGLFNRAKLWARAMRAPFFTATIIPILLGAILAWNVTNTIDLFTLLLTVISGVAIHAGTNMLNDYFDHTSRNDEKNKNATPFNGGSRTIQAGLMSSTKVGIVAILFFLIGTMGALYLETIIGGNVILVLLILGVFLGIFYTADPLRIGYTGLGEVAVALGFGPVFVVVSWFVQTRSLELIMPIFWSVPIALLIANVLLINEFQDLDADKAVGKNTLVVRLGKRRSVLLYKTSLSLSYLWIIAGALIYFHNASLTLIALITVPLALKAVHLIEKKFDTIYDLIPGNVMTIGIHLLTGVLLIVGLALTKVLAL